MDGLVIVAGVEAIDELREYGDAHSPRQMVVERRYGLAEERCVVGELGSFSDSAPAGDLEVQPARRWVVDRSRQPPPGTGRRVALTYVGQTHGRVRPARRSAWSRHRV